MSKTPCVVTVEEISRKTVIIMVDNDDPNYKLTAEQTAFDLTNSDKIQLDYGDFQERNCRFQHLAAEHEVELYTKANSVFDGSELDEEV